MVKKVFLIVISLIIIISGYFIFDYFKKQQIPEFDTYKCIPLDASFIIESDDFIQKINSVRKNNAIWDEILLFPSNVLSNLQSENAILFFYELPDWFASKYNVPCT